MKLGIVTPVVMQLPEMHAAWEESAGLDEIVRVAVEAERLGYHHVTCSHHVGVPRNAGAGRGTTYWDPWVTLGAIATRTSTIKLATFVIVLGYQHPLVIAKAIGTLDQVSHGRAILGVGVGNFRWVSVEDYQNSRFSALHNAYLLTLVEGGLLLFIPYLLLFRRTWKELALTRHRAAEMPGLRLRWLVDATRTVFALFLIFSLFADLWHLVFLYLIIGLAAVLARLHRPALEPVET